LYVRYCCATLKTFLHLLTLLQVREQVMQRYRIATHQKTYADMIREDAVPDIGFVLYCRRRLQELVPPRCICFMFSDLNFS